MCCSFVTFPLLYSPCSKLRSFGVYNTIHILRNPQHSILLVVYIRDLRRGLLLFDDGLLFELLVDLLELLPRISWGVRLRGISGSRGSGFRVLRVLSCRVHKPQQVYTFRFIVGNIIPKSVKCIHSATKVLRVWDVGSGLRILVLWG